MASSKRADAHTTAAAATGAAASSAAAGWGDQERSAANQTEMSDIQRLRFEATVNGRYHTSRRGWYELMHRWCMFVVVIGGAAAVAEAVGNGHKYSWMVA